MRPPQQNLFLVSLHLVCGKHLGKCGRERLASREAAIAQRLKPPYDSSRNRSFQDAQLLFPELEPGVFGRVERQRPVIPLSQYLSVDDESACRGILVRPEQVRDVMTRDTVPLFSPGHPFLLHKGKTAFNALTNRASVVKRCRSRLASQAVAEKHKRENNDDTDVDSLF